MALRDGADLKTISAALGHSSTGVTEKVYAFVAQEAVAAAWGAATERVHQRRRTPDPMRVDPELRHPSR